MWISHEYPLGRVESHDADRVIETPTHRVVARRAAIDSARDVVPDDREGPGGGIEMSRGPATQRADRGVPGAPSSSRRSARARRASSR